ncbi:MAG: ATP-binding cassette domain-containing protein [Christensenellaceae bacterium]|nr:ATP-binding cassette domain-containing protein [Christensenellaceae bacterium]
MPNGEVVALNNINLDIEKGDIYGIIGMSGAGKSTLIRCMNKLDVPTDGQIYIDGENVLAMNNADLRKIRRRMGMIFQSFNLLMQKNVTRNVRYPLEIAGVPKTQANKRVKELLKIVGLESKAEAFPAQLSGGQQQRVAIARALASDPDMLLCDEATSALDPMTTQSILELLKDINKRLGITVVIITHEMAVIRQICNKVAILDDGKLVEEGNVDDVFMNTKSKAGRRLFGIISEDISTEALGQPAYRIVFDGGVADQPIISRMSRELNVDVNILAADVKQLNEKTYGQMLISIPKDTKERLKIKEFLEQKNITVEEVIP